jgi:hypothetical protein
LDLVFTNVLVDIAVESAETPLLKLDRHHKAYEIEMQICCFKFEAMEGGIKRYRFKLPNCAAFGDGLDAVDFCSLIVTLIFKKGRRNNAEDYRYVADPMVQWL